MPAGYVDTKYKPTENDLICSFYVEPAPALTLKEAAEDVAAESSIGTWTEIVTMKPEIAQKLKPHVFELKKTGEIKVAYPAELFEPGNMPQIYSSIAGNIFGMKAVTNLRLNDIEFPARITRSFKGPAFGIEGIRRIARVPERPLVGTIIKPKVGLGPREHAGVAFNAWAGGCDVVKDDENLSNQSFNPFNERVIQTLDARDRAEATGEKKIYMPNVTAETGEMIKRAQFVKDHGGRYAMIDILTCGFSGLQALRDANLGLVIHAHRAMHAAFTRNDKHGISMLALAKSVRLIGVDQLHIGTAVGKMADSPEDVKAIKKGLEEKAGVKPVFSVCSGGLHPGLVEQLVKMLGKDIIIQAGGGVHGHPDGTAAGATAMRQAVDAAVKGVPAKDYARTHAELRKALEKWSK